MTIKSRKKTRSGLKRVSATSDSSSTDSNAPYESSAFYYQSNTNDDVIKWGYVLLLTCWFVFVAGIGGVLGVWDCILGFRNNQIVELACYFSLIIVTGFAWTVLNWYVLPPSPVQATLTLEGLDLNPSE